MGRGTQRLSKADVSGVEVLAPVNLQAGVITYTKAFDQKKGEITAFHLFYEDSAAVAVHIQASNHPNATASGSSQDPDTFPAQGGHGEPKHWFTYNFDDVTPSISGSDGSIAEGSILYDLSGTGATWMRLQLTPTTSGEVSCYVTAKPSLY